MFKWEYGRQGSGYQKLMLASSKYFKFDMFIIRIPQGVRVPKHVDPALTGFANHRFNFTLKKPDVGGTTFIQGVKQVGRGYIFRPDIAEHEVSEVLDGELVLISIGWLTKIK